MLMHTGVLFASAAALVVALLSAWVTVQLALRRFRTEKWWERQADAYDRVINALHEMKGFWQRQLDAAARDRDLSEDEEELLSQQYSKAKHEIDRAVDLGSYVLGNEARGRLERYQQEMKLARHDHWVESLIAGADTSSDCLSDLIVIARREMGAADAFNWRLSRFFRGRQ